MSRRRGDHGSAVPEFVLVMVVVLPLFLGIAQLALVLHVRNTLVAAASDGARAGAALGSGTGEARARAREVVRTTLADRFADGVAVRTVERSGLPVVEVVITGEVPPLGLWGPAVTVRARGHAVIQEEP